MHRGVDAGGPAIVVDKCAELPQYNSTDFFQPSLIANPSSHVMLTLSFTDIISEEGSKIAFANFGILHAEIRNFYCILVQN